MRCINCNVNIDESLINCPLCNKNLSSETKNKLRIYPVYKNTESIRLKYNILILCCICISFISFFTNIFFFKNTFWSIFIIGISFYIYFFIKHTIYSNSRIGERIFYNFLVTSLILFLFDITTVNTGFSFNYIIPILVIGILFSINMMTFIYKFKWIDFFIYHIIFFLICISCFIYYLYNKTDLTWAWIIAIYFSVVSVLFIAIQFNKKLKNALMRILHI